MAKIKGLAPGLGVYLRSWVKTRNHSPELWARAVKSYGYTWVALKGPWWKEGGYSSRPSVKQHKELVPAFVDAGLQVHVWTYPAPGAREFDRAIREYIVPGVQGILLDPEKPFKRATDRSANALVDVCRQRLPAGHVLGMTSYGSLPSGIPWDGFASCDYFSPQIYTPDTNSAGYPVSDTEADVEVRTYIQRWAEQYKLSKIVPSFGLYQHYRKGRDSKKQTIPRIGMNLEKHVSSLIANTVTDSMIGWSWFYDHTAQRPALKRLSKALVNRECT